MGILPDGGTFDPVCRSSMAHRKTQEGGASSNRQTSPRIKGRHLKENCCSPRWRSIIFAVYSILPGHLREAAFQPMLC